ncbi:hypothetical protein ACLOJK_008856 [Asimina triloba]
MHVACWTELCCRLIWAVVRGRRQRADGGDEAATGAGSGQREEAVAGAWAATSAVGAGEAVAMAACCRRNNGRPGSVDPGLVDDEKMAIASFGRFDGWMKL